MMKFRKTAVLTMGLAVLMMVLTGCVSTKEAVSSNLFFPKVRFMSAPVQSSPKVAAFTSKDGIVITATNQWRQLKTKEELAELYTDTMDDELYASVDLALKIGDQVYFTVEKVDVSADLADMDAISTLLKEYIADYDQEEVTAMLSDSGYSDEEIELLFKLLEEDADYDLLYQQFSNLSWFARLEETCKDYKFIGSEEATILGQTSSLSEYCYTNDDDVKLHFYEASLIKDGELYTLNGWCEEKSFDKNKAMLKSMIITAKWAQ